MGDHKNDKGQAELYQRAQDLYASGDARGARTVLQDLLLLAPEHLDARNDLGAIYCNEGRPEIALMHFDIAVKGDPTNKVYLENLRSAEQVISCMDQPHGAYDEIVDDLPRDVIEVSAVDVTPPPATRQITQIPARTEEPNAAPYVEHVQKNNRAPIQLLPRITLGIPTRNRVDPLMELLESIQRQTFQNFDLIISDDGDRFDIPSEIQRRFPTLQFRHIRGPQKNLPANRQNIMDASRTEFVMMCDDDHIMRDDCVEQLVKTIVQDEQIESFARSGQILRINHALFGSKTSRNVEEYKLDLDDIGYGSDFWWKNGTETFKSYSHESRLLESQVSGGGCLIYRRSAVEIAGGFPHDMSVVSFREDTDMSHRVYMAGYRILINTDAIALHMCSPQGGCRDTRDWEENFVRDGLKFIERLRSWRTRAAQLTQIEKHLLLKIALMYDQKGWAWWHRSHFIKQHISPGIAEFEVCKLDHNFRHEAFDFVFSFDYNV